MAISYQKEPHHADTFAREDGVQNSVVKSTEVRAFENTADPQGCDPWHSNDENDGVGFVLCGDRNDGNIQTLTATTATATTTTTCSWQYIWDEIW